MQFDRRLRRYTLVPSKIYLYFFEKPTGLVFPVLCGLSKLLTSQKIPRTSIRSKTSEGFWQESHTKTNICKMLFISCPCHSSCLTGHAPK
uniref:AlNc14C464G11797 protein n=1 Tax=Albugo laibachii Nc14 TaxID=890382 RepID=F0X059_9STRA|nr:AlNc14C464G11797 [Albugo laibachii Nc14]|eukprot:CCA27141.1 AlNc14C464G11797 [Albugo laibachii Nc14]